MTQWGRSAEAGGGTAEHLNRIADAQVGEHRLGVVDLVSHNHQKCVLVQLAGTLQVVLLALQPRRLLLTRRRVGERVAAVVHDAGHHRAEAGLDIGEASGTTLILSGVMEQGGNGLVLVATGTPGSGPGGVTPLQAGWGGSSTAQSSPPPCRGRHDPGGRQPFSSPQRTSGPAMSLTSQPARICSSTSGGSPPPGPLHGGHLTGIATTHDVWRSTVSRRRNIRIEANATSAQA
jgi:hypothetical protein